MDDNNELEIMVLVMVSGVPLIGRAESGVPSDLYSRDGRSILLKDPLGITTRKSPDADPSKEMPFVVLDVLTLSDTTEIQIHEDKILYMYPASEEIVIQYENILAIKRGSLPSSDLDDPIDIDVTIDRQEQN